MNNNEDNVNWDDKNDLMKKIKRNVNENKDSKYIYIYCIYIYIYIHIYIYATKARLLNI